MRIQLDPLGTLRAADGAPSLLIVHLRTWAKVRKGVSAIVSLGMHVELVEFVPCAKQFLMLQVLGKLKPKNKGGEGPLAGNHGAEISVTGRFPLQSSV